MPNFAHADSFQVNMFRSCRVSIMGTFSKLLSSKNSCKICDTCACNIGITKWNIFASSWSLTCRYSIYLHKGRVFVIFCKRAYGDAGLLARTYSVWSRLLRITCHFFLGLHNFSGIWQYWLRYTLNASIFVSKSKADICMNTLLIWMWRIFILFC